MLVRLPNGDYVDPSEVVTVVKTIVQYGYDGTSWKNAPGVAICTRSGSRTEYRLGDTTIDEWAGAISNPIPTGGPYR